MCSPSKVKLIMMRGILNVIDYDKHQWLICATLKVIAILMGLRGGYTKCCCYICEWDSRAKDFHYKQKDLPRRQSLWLGKKNASWETLVNPSKVLLLPIVKLGLIMPFAKAVNKSTERALEYLR